MKLSVWTPRYAWDRVAFALYQRRHPDKPWLTQSANSVLDSLIRHGRDVGLEWGSGRSTLWFARRLKHLTSIENEPVWHDRVKGMLADAGASNVDYRLLNIGAGHDDPTSPYVRVIDGFADASLDFILVDGFARSHCACGALEKLSPGGILAIDNINWFLDHPTRSPSSRFGKGPYDPTWGALAERVKDWRMIWTSSGVTDTAIWIKPPAPPR